MPAKPKKPAAKAAKGGRYQVVLRTRTGAPLVAEVEDRVLYPRAVAWNRVLSSDRGRQLDQDKEVKAWRENALDAILDLANAGAVPRKKAVDFIKAAAQSGVVQVEMVWNREDVGWAARVFPWEALLALATKDERIRIGRLDFVVVRVLTGGRKVKPAAGPPGFAVSESAECAGFDVKTERAAVEAGLQCPLQPLAARSLAELTSEVETIKPRIVHLVLNSAENSAALPTPDSEGPNELHTQQVAKAVASHGPEIVAFSSCYTGRRLAPLAVACGAKIAMGFHGEVSDASIPVFFGAFYRAWKKEPDALAALRAGLAANKSQTDPAALGTITLWSAVDLIGQRAAPKPQDEALVEFGVPAGGGAIKAADAKSALPVNC